MIRNTLKVQLGLLAILLEENLGKEVKRAKVIFEKDKRTELEVELDLMVKSYALDMLAETKQVMGRGIEPEEQPDNRCINCCFRKVCTAGFLYTQE